MKTAINRIVWFLTVMIAGACGLSAQPQFKKVASAPILYDPPRMSIPLVWLKINDAPPALFAIVSDFPALVAVDKAEAQKLGVPQNGEGWVNVRNIVLSNNTGDSLASLGPPIIWVGKFNMPQFGESLEIVGIVGANFFAALPVEIDFRSKQITILDSSTRDYYKQSLTNWVLIPLKPSREESFAHSVLVTLPPKKEVSMVVATGTYCSTISESEAGHIDFSVFQPFALESLGYSPDKGFGRVRSMFGLVDSLDIGGITVRGVPLCVESPQKSSSLGVDILSLFGRVILDFQSHMMLVEKPEGNLTARQLGRSGLSLRKDAQGHFQVVEVVPGGSGDKAGFQKGDQILSINGASVTGLEPLTVQLMLDGIADTPQIVQIRRSEETKNLTLTPISPFKRVLEKPSLGIYGFGVFGVEDESGEIVLVVTDVKGLAKQAGLKAGDRIVAINNRRIPEWDETELIRTMLNAEQVVLTVVRLGQREEKEIRLVRPKQQSGV